MLTWSVIVNRIHEELSLPFQMLEKSDQEIIDYLKRNALPKFEMYFPQKWRLTLDCSDPTVKVPGRFSEYYLIDPDGREIKTITGMISNIQGDLIHGHPIMGPFTFDQVPEWLLAVYQARNMTPFSMYTYHFEFIPPNMIRITPEYTAKCVIEYERSHDPELSSILPELHDVFIDLCIGMFFMNIGRLRQKYSSSHTPFGEIPLNGDALFNEGKEIYDKTIELMKTGSLPNVTIEVG